MTSAPHRVTLRAPRNYALTAVALGFLLVSVGILTEAPRDIPGVAIALAIGLPALWAVPTSLRAGVVADGEGIVERSVFGKERYAWADIKDVRSEGNGDFMPSRAPVVELHDGEQFMLNVLSRYAFRSRGRGASKHQRDIRCLRQVGGLETDSGPPSE